MSWLVCMHGIGQQAAGEELLLHDWRPVQLDGLTRAGHRDAVRAGDVAMAFYGNLFRAAGERLAVGDPIFTANDVEAGLEKEILLRGRRRQLEWIPRSHHRGRNTRPSTRLSAGGVAATVPFLLFRWPGFASYGVRPQTGQRLSG
jgi:hypothetical protein